MQVQSLLLSLGAYNCNLQSRNNRATIRQVAAGLAAGHDAAFSKQIQLREPDCKTSHDDADDFLRPPPSPPTHALFPIQRLCAQDCRIDLVKSRICGKADSTLRSSQAVPHPSTNRALCCLTSEVERDPVHSTRYGRRRKYATAHAYNLGQKEPRCAIMPICSVFVLLHFHQAHEVQESHTAQSHIITDLCCSKMSTIHSGHY